MKINRPKITYLYHLRSDRISGAIQSPDVLSNKSTYVCFDNYLFGIKFTFLNQNEKSEDESFKATILTVVGYNRYLVTSSVQVSNMSSEL